MEAARRRLKYIEVRVNWAKLVLPVDVVNEADGRRCNFTVPFDNGWNEIMKKASAFLVPELPRSCVLLSTVWVDPRRSKELPFKSDYDLESAAMMGFGQSKTHVRMKKPILIRVKKIHKMGLSRRGVYRAPKTDRSVAASLEHAIVKNAKRINRSRQWSEKYLGGPVRLNGTERAAKYKETKARQKEKSMVMRKERSLKEKEKKEKMKKDTEMAREKEQQRLKEMTISLPPEAKTYPGIVWSPFLKEFEAVFINSGSRHRLGTFKTREIAWSAICLHGSKLGIPKSEIAKAAGMGHVIQHGSALNTPKSSVMHRAANARGGNRKGASYALSGAMSKDG